MAADTSTATAFAFPKCRSRAKVPVPVPAPRSAIRLGWPAASPPTQSITSDR